MGLNAFLIFMSSNKGLEPKKQFWPIRMKLSKPFHRHLFHYAVHLLHELLSNMHRINCPTPVGRTKIRPLTCCVISLAQYMSYFVLPVMSSNVNFSGLITCLFGALCANDMIRTP